MTTLSFNSIPNDIFESCGEKPELTRIRNVIESLGNYGVEKQFLFSVDDLWLKKDTEKVVKCLEQVEKLVGIFYLY